jgi:hypothetical protein
VLKWQFYLELSLFLCTFASEIRNSSEDNLKRDTIMAFYIVKFYDHQESGEVEHNEVYTSRRMADKRILSLYNKMDRYSWVTLYEGQVQFERVRCGKCITDIRSCGGYEYHGDTEDF